MAPRSRVQKAKDRVQRATEFLAAGVIGAAGQLERAQKKLDFEEARAAAQQLSGDRKAAIKQAEAKRRCPDNHPRRRPWNCYCTFGPPSCDSCSIQSECAVCGRLLRAPPTPGETERS